MMETFEVLIPTGTDRYSTRERVVRTVGVESRAVTYMKKTTFHGGRDRLDRKKEGEGGNHTTPHHTTL